MIYLNNAATTYPKPQCVQKAYTAAISEPPVSQFRSMDSRHGGDIFDACRKKLGQIFQVKEYDRIYFSSGATDSMNAVISGLRLFESRIITTRMEHNSVLRPLFNMGRNGSEGERELIFVDCKPDGKVEPSAIDAAITGDGGVIIINHCSNVTGTVQDMETIGRIAKKHHLIFVADVSQSAGCLPVHADQWGVDILVFTGHKSLFGIQGTGGYYIRKGIDIPPFRYGGTGKNSLLLTYEKGSYEYEVGTQNTPGIAALNAGAGYVLNRGISNIMERDRMLIRTIYYGLKEMPNVILYGEDTQLHGPVISFNIMGLKPADVAYILQNGYDITVRAGFHCAPLIHDSLGTKEYGTVRVSVSDLNREEEIRQFLEAVRTISMGMIS